MISWLVLFSMCLWAFVSLVTQDNPILFFGIMTVTYVALDRGFAWLN